MTINIRNLTLCIFALSLFMLGACSEDMTRPEGNAFSSVAEVEQTSVVNEAGFTRYDGVIGGENVYAFLVPDDWNGELVLYAHGFVDSAAPLTLPVKDNVEAIRDQVVDMGFAWAYCSYRENGLAVKDGAWATRRLQMLFKSTVKSAPSYTWLMAHSLGGLIAIELAEKHPGEYDGIVTLAGLNGGSKAQIDYVGDVRVLFDLFYPGVLPGTVSDPLPEDWTLFDVQMAIIQAVTADPTGLGAISRLVPLPFTSGEQLVESLITAIVFNYRGIEDILERTHGACPFDNFDRVYAGELPPHILGFVNASVQRYDRSIPVDELFDRYYEPNGRLAVEMIALHLRWDPIVPLFAEDIYAAKVAATGNSHLLEGRVLNLYGHTTEIPVPDVIQAFADLRAKVVPATPVAFTQ
ncbi:hypothetical protein DRQ53_12105 [bacterium]|nr:MAG: hypothetical protein DRQ53_12105 [bacterium]